MDGPVLSVIIATKGHEPYLEKLLLSLRTQKGWDMVGALRADASCTFEIIIVDAPPFSNIKTAQFWDVKYICQAEGRKGTAMNMGARVANCNLMLFVDADVSLPHEALDQALLEMVTKDVVCALRRHEILGLSAPFEWIYRRFGFVCGWFCMMRRETLESLGGWSDDYIEDLKMWQAAREKGIKIGFIQDRVVLHRKVRAEAKKMIVSFKEIVREGWS